MPRRGISRPKTHRYFASYRKFLRGFSWYIGVMDSLRKNVPMPEIKNQKFARWVGKFFLAPPSPQFGCEKYNKEQFFKYLSEFLSDFNADILLFSVFLQTFFFCKNI